VYELKKIVDAMPNCLVITKSMKRKNSKGSQKSTVLMLSKKHRRINELKRLALLLKILLMKYLEVVYLYYLPSEV
jgi:hypothetical protein